MVSIRCNGLNYKRQSNRLLAYGKHIWESRQFPNPARVSTNARFDKPIKVMTFQIYDMNGRLIRIYEAREVKDGEEYSLDLTFLQPGMYFIRTIDENGMMLSKPIIIEY